MAIETEWIAELNLTFARTPEYCWFEEFAQACARYHYIGLCVGRPGVGKTWSARYLSGWEALTSQVQHQLRDPLARVSPAVASRCHAVLYTAPMNNTPRLLREELAYHFDVYAEGLLGQGQPRPTGDTSIPLLLVDEADRLTTSSLEYLRELYDRLGFGLVLIGLPSLERRIKRYAQLYSRVGFSHQFRPMSQVDMLELLRQSPTDVGYPFCHPPFAGDEARQTIVRLARGNLRHLIRLFEQVERLALINEQTQVTVALLEGASKLLVPGNIE